AIREERVVSPAAEWLVDNFHIVDEQVREIRDHLPSGFYRELPKLAEKHLAGYPRVLGIAWAFVAHTDSRFDIEALRRFVRAYQRVQPLQIGELWAVAITLRIVLVENLRRLAERIVRARLDRQRADALATGLLGLTGRPAAAAAGPGRGCPARPAPPRSQRAAAKLPRSAGAAAAGAGSRRRACAALARRAAGGAGHDDRGDRAPGARGAGRHERDRPQRDHEHASHVGARLEGLLRERQPGRRDPALEDQLPRHGLRDARSLPPRDRAARAPLRPCRDRRGSASRGQDGDPGRRRSDWTPAPA